jgi:hypothetical protein
MTYAAASLVITVQQAGLKNLATLPLRSGSAGQHESVTGNNLAIIGGRRNFAVPLSRCIR